MARRYGSLDMNTNVEPQVSMPLDARQHVRTKSERLDTNSFPPDYSYKGLITASQDEEKLFFLLDPQNPQLEESWKEIGPYDDSSIKARVTALENSSGGGGSLPSDFNISGGDNVQVAKSGNTYTISATDTKPDVNKAYVDAQILSLDTRLEVVDASRLPNPIWVSTTGNDDTGDGSQENPFRQIQTAISKISNNKGHAIYVDAGTYTSFILNYGKNVTIYLRGNVTLTPQNNPNIWVYSGCTLRILSMDSTVRNLTFQNTTGNVSFYCIYNSNVTVEDTVKIIFSNHTNSNATLFSVMQSSSLWLNCHIGYTGTFTPSAVFLANAGGTLIWTPPTTGTSNIQSPTGTVGFFASAIRASTISIIAEDQTINNNFTVGLRAFGAIVTCSMAGNEAQTPINQVRGGRVFTPQNLASTNSITPMNPSLSEGDSNDVVIDQDFPLNDNIDLYPM